MNESLPLSFVSRRAEHPLLSFHFNSIWYRSPVYTHTALLSRPHTHTVIFIASLTKCYAYCSFFYNFSLIYSTFFSSILKLCYINLSSNPSLVLTSFLWSHFYLLISPPYYFYFNLSSYLPFLNSSNPFSLLHSSYPIYLLSTLPSLLDSSSPLSLALRSWNTSTCRCSSAWNLSWRTSPGPTYSTPTSSPLRPHCWGTVTTTALCCICYVALCCSAILCCTVLWPMHSGVRWCTVQLCTVLLCASLCCVMLK